METQIGNVQNKTNEENRWMGEGGIIPRVT